jgi:hypothetical protein
MQAAGRTWRKPHSDLLTHISKIQDLPGGRLILNSLRYLLIFEKYPGLRHGLLILLLYGCATARAQLTYQTLTVDYDSAWQYKNLKIIPIRGRANPGNPPGGSDLMTLNQAIKKGLATVTERGTASTENVHWLRINNHSDKSLYVSSGEVISGGRQDRIIAHDTILHPTNRDQYIPVMCVEEGRWSEKEKKLAYSNFANPYLRKVLDQTKNQVLIWKEIGNQLAQSNSKSKTLAYLSRMGDKKSIMLNDDYFNFFVDKFKKADSTITGIVCVSGNRVIGCDIFVTRDLFYGQLEPLLRGYIDGAVFFGAPVNIPDLPIIDYMDKILSSEKSQEEFVNANGKIFRDEGRVVHINTF